MPSSLWTVASIIKNIHLCFIFKIHKIKFELKNKKESTFQCRGHGFDGWLGNWDASCQESTWPMPHQRKRAHRLWPRLGTAKQAPEMLSDHRLANTPFFHLFPGSVHSSFSFLFASFLVGWCFSLVVCLVLFLWFLCIYYKFLFCGYQRIQIYWPRTISACFKLVVI